MTSALTGLYALLLVCSVAVADEGRRWHVVPLEADAPLSIPLPPLSTVTSGSGAGDTWQQSGQLGGSVAGVHGDFSAALAAGGWTLRKTIVLGRGEKRSEIMMWSRRRQRILLMVWEIEAGMCGFAWGKDQ